MVFNPVGLITTENNFTICGKFLYNVICMSELIEMQRVTCVFQ